MVSHKNRHRDQWNRIESLETNLHIYEQLVYKRRVMNIYMEKEWSLQ